MEKNHCRLLQVMMLAMMVAVCTATSLFAQQVSEQQARSRAVEFMSEINKAASYQLRAKKFNMKTSQPSALDSQLKLVYTAKKQDEVHFYVFNNPDGGWVMVSGNDVTEDDVIAYSYEGSFKYEGAPENLKNYLGKYERQIAYAIQQSQVNGQRSTVNGLRKSPVIKTATKVDIDPLIQSHWDQDAPYWNMCPSDNGGTCLTGCVATAMAQVMRYWQWPVRGTGSKTYTDSDGCGRTLSTTFSDHTYDYANMPLETSGYNNNTKKNAVAQLMYDCGVSVSMEYTSDGSGAYSQDIPNALSTYFSYKNTAHYYTSTSPNNNTWKDRVYNDLAAGRPVLYDGYSKKDGGHEFVCDGYQVSTGKFHFNWGWSGQSDGYFAIGTLKPGYNFSEEEGCIIGVEPNAGFVVDKTSINKGMVVVNQAVQETFTVTPSNLANNITISATAGSLSKTSISKTTTTAQTITYTYTPTSTGNKSATITISDGTTQKQIAFSCTAGYAINTSYDDTKGTILAEEAGVPGEQQMILTECNNGYVLSALTVVGNTSHNQITVTPTLSAAEDTYYFTMPSEAVTINATFGTPASYTITWLTGENTYTTTHVTEGNHLILPTPPTAPTGYTFIGWTAQSSVNSDGSGITFISNETVPTANTTYYAVYAVASGSGSGSYERVNSAPTDWSGNYLLVYEADSETGYVWTGVDANVNHADATISNETISSKPDGAVTLTIAPMTSGYSIMVNGGANDGKYISGTSGSNALNFGDAAALNTLSREDGSAVITSNTSVMRFNKASGTERFRYYKSSSYDLQQKVQLYKEIAGASYSDYTLTPGSTPTVYYTVTWSNDDTTTPEQYEEGSALVLPTAPTAPTGTTFCGWSATQITDNTPTAPSYISAGGAVNADATYYAVYSYVLSANTYYTLHPNDIPSPTYYTVTWNNCDTETQVQYEEGQALVLPTTPVAPDDYTFCGWSSTAINDDITAEPTFITAGGAVNADATYYAIYSYTEGGGGGDPVTTTTTFNSNSWGDADSGWTSGKNGNQYTTNQGVQVTTGSTGANATSKVSYTDVSSIVVNYCTNASKGAGQIKVKVGDGTEKSFTVTTNGGTTLRNTDTFTFSPAESGPVTLSVFCSTNSIYINSISITTGGGGTSTTYYTRHPEGAVTPHYAVNFIDKGDDYQMVNAAENTPLTTVAASVTAPTNDNTNYPGYQFAGWSLNNSTTSPQFITSSDLLTENVVLYAIYGLGGGAGGWAQTTSVQVGDEVIIAEIDEGTKELNGFNTTTTTYGTGADFTTIPAGTIKYTVVAGNQANTFAFQNQSNNKYLYWSNGNSLLENATLSDNTSWKLNAVNSRVKMTNAVQDNSKDRVIYWATNGSSTQRFACYTGKSHGMFDNYNYYYYPVFYTRQSEYSLEIPPVPVGVTLAGLEVPAVKTDGSTILIDHTTTISGNDVRTYCLEFDKATYHARWVAFRFDDDTRDLGSGRNDSFRDDPDLPSEYWIGSNAFGSYTINGQTETLSRGHICASYDRQYSVEANKQTFYMTNMSPMISNRFNSGYWGNLESKIQEFGRDENFSDTLYVVKGGTIYGDKIYGTVARTNGNMVIPKYYYMAVLRSKKDAQGRDGYKAIGYLMQHQEYSESKYINHPEFVVSIDSLEKFTGIDFFPGLPDDVEDAVEGITVTNTVRNDWGFSQTPSSDTYPFVYHNPVSTVTTSMMSDYAYSTFYNDCAKTIPSGITAYIATDATSKTSVKMTELEGGVIPANCGVILRSAEGHTYELNDATTKSTDDVSANMLVGWTHDTAITGSTTTSFYALNYETVNNQKKVGLFAPKGAGNPNGSFTAKAGKAYLKLPGQQAAKISMRFDGDPTDINDVEGANANAKANGMYNLAGQKVDDSYHGIVIVNGKKRIK